MPTKVFIIEDFAEDHLRLAAVLDRFDIEYFPTVDDRHAYSDLFASWAGEKLPEDFNEIRAAIEHVKPDFIFLDIGLKGNDVMEDRSGIELKEKLLDKYFQEIPVFTITGRFRDRHASIWKSSEAVLESEILKKFIAIHGIKEKPLKVGSTQDAFCAENGANQDMQVNSEIFSDESSHTTHAQSTDNTFNSNERGDGKEEKFKIRRKKGPADTEEIKRLLKKYSEPAWLSNLKAVLNSKFEPSIRYLAHAGITYMFYVLIVFLALLAPYKIFLSVIGAHDILVVAETAFVAFLPLLVVFGFFVFYWQSLRPYLVGTLVEDMDFEKTSELMSLTKKLFVSSLISYLFTKLVELLFFNPGENHRPINAFQEYYAFEKPYMHLVVIGTLIVILTLYYVYLSSNHQAHAKKGQ